MSRVSAVPGIPANENDGQISTATDRFARVVRINGQRISFGELARFAWPQKAEAHLSALTGCDARTCRRWLAEDNEPPAEALALCLAEIAKLLAIRV